MQIKNKKRVKIKIGRLSAVIVLITAFSFSPFNGNFFAIKKVWADDDYISITEDTIWKKTDDLVFDKEIDLENGATLTIEPGATIKFKKGEQMPSMFVFDGRIIAEGAESEPITFTADNPEEEQRFSLFFQNDSAAEISRFRYVTFSHAGLESAGPPTAEGFIKNVQASGSGTGAIYFQSGTASFENCSFSNNQYSDFEIDFEISPEENRGDFLKIVNSNFEASGDSAAVLGEVYCPYDQLELCDQRVILKNNWYGDPSGPDWKGSGALGKKVEGNFDLEGFRKKDLIADPAIIIPGIMGSAEKNDSAGNWILDPLLHTYDDLAASLETNGCEAGFNLFGFPYDWRNKNEITALALKAKIEQIRNLTGVSQVDLIAHSMGGLVARSYIEGSNYNNDVDQVIELGTPNRGAPKAYLQWEAGEGFFGWDGYLLEHHISREAKHNGYNSIYEYIRNKVKSVEQLLPDYNYLYDVADSQMRNYPSGYPDNDFLENLNNSENLSELNRVRLINIVGKANSDNSTISKIRVVRTTEENIWEDGMPEGFYDSSTDQGLEKGRGDETVPKYSAEDIPAAETIEIDSTHLDLPDKSQCLVFKKLTGKTNCMFVDEWHIPNLLYFNVFSPIDIQVVSPDGKRVGKDFATGEILNEIPGAFYSGYGGDEEYLTIPNPQDGKYQVKIQGTGNGGEYKIEATRISEEENQEAKELTAEFSGISEVGFQEETAVEISPEAVTFGSQDKEAPKVSITSPEASQYFNNQKVKIIYSVTDNVSAPEKIQAEMFLDEAKLADSNLDLSLLHLGTHKVEVSAKDEAQNEGTAEVEFTLDTSIDAVISNIKHYVDLGLIKSKKEGQILTEESKEIRSLLKFLEKIKSMPLPAKFRKMAIEIQEKIINHQIDKLIWRINIQKKNKLIITPRVAELLIESLNYIRP